MHHESALKSALVKTASTKLHGFVVMRHEDVRTKGIPDISFSGFGRDSWLEVKHATPRFASSGQQELQMLRLAASSYHARYLVYFEDKNGDSKRTLIVHPRHIHDLLPEAWTTGHDHAWVCAHLLKVHRP